MRLLAVGAEGPFVGVTAGVGAVAFTKALGLPVPCRDLGENHGYVGGQSSRGCVLAGTDAVGTSGVRPT